MDKRRVQNLCCRIELKSVILMMLIVFTGTVSWGRDNRDIRFTPQEKSWITAHPVLRVVINAGPPPLSLWGKNQNTSPRKRPPGTDPPDFRPKPPFPFPPGPEPLFPGRPMGPPTGADEPLIRVRAEDQDDFQGIAADYLAAVSEITGIEFVVTHAFDHNFPRAIDALFRQESDLIPLMLLKKENELKRHLKGLHLTRPYVRIPVVIVTRPDEPYIDDLKKLRKMRVSGVMSAGEKLRSAGLHIPFTHVSPREGLMGVATGRFDALVSEMSFVSDTLSSHSITNVKISGELPAASEYAVLVGPALKPFVSIFNKAIDAIPPQTKDMIWQKWFRVSYEKKLISSMWVKAGLAVGALLIFAGFLAARHFYKKFHTVRTTVEALDPHLLSVSVDNNIVITDVTEALCNATGFQTRDLLGKPLIALGSPVTDSANATDAVWKTLEKGNTWNGEVKIVKKNGTALWAEAVISPLRRKSDGHEGFTIIYQDVTQKKHFETLATKDELTGLYNRRHFNNTLPKMLKKAAGESALFILDVDYFKKYNDTYGHPAGDRVLAAIGSALRRLFQRSGDMVFRLGGEEFGIAVRGVSPAEAEAIAGKILNSIRNLEIDHAYNPPGIVTVSVGGAVTSPRKPEAFDTLYKEADKALYRAKQTGRNRFVIS